MQNCKKSMNVGCFSGNDDPLVSAVCVLTTHLGNNIF